MAMPPHVRLLAAFAMVPVLTTAARAQGGQPAGRPVLMCTDLLLPAVQRDGVADSLSALLAQVLSEWSVVPASMVRQHDLDFWYRDHQTPLALSDLREAGRAFRAQAILMPIITEAGGFRLILQLPRQSADTATIYLSEHRPDSAALRALADSVSKLARRWLQLSARKPLNVH